MIQTTSATIRAMTSTQNSSMKSTPKRLPPIMPPPIIEPKPPIMPPPPRTEMRSRTRTAPPSPPSRTFKPSLIAYTPPSCSCGLNLPPERDLSMTKMAHSHRQSCSSVAPHVPLDHGLRRSPQSQRRRACRLRKLIEELFALNFVIAPIMPIVMFLPRESSLPKPFPLLVMLLNAIEVRFCAHGGGEAGGRGGAGIALTTLLPHKTACKKGSRRFAGGRLAIWSIITRRMTHMAQDCAAPPAIR